MSDDIPTYSRLILAQVLGRVCFPQNHGVMLCAFKNASSEDLASSCEDEIDERVECQKEVFEFFQDKPAFIKYEKCLDDNAFFWDQCNDEKEAFTAYVQDTVYRFQ